MNKQDTETAGPMKLVFSHGDRHFWRNFDYFVVEDGQGIQSKETRIPGLLVRLGTGTSDKTALHFLLPKRFNEVLPPEPKRPRNLIDRALDMALASMATLAVLSLIGLASQI